MSVEQAEYTGMERVILRGELGRLGEAIYGAEQNTSLWAIGQHFSRLLLTEIDKALQEIGSNYALVAIPMEKVVTNPDLWSILPQTGAKEYPYFVHIVAKELAADFFQSVGISAADNQARLSQTGILMIRPDTETARLVHARWS